MTREEAKEFVLKEKLSNYNFNESREDNENEVVIRSRDNIWVVYVTDERASKVTGSELVYEREVDAWDDVIERLRADKRLRSSCYD